MNKKGFTLVELLAVIVILALLAVVANSSVTNVVKNSKSDLYNTQIELIKSAAETWGLDNIDKLPNEGTCSYITLKDLKAYGLFEEEIINPKTNKEFSNNLTIKITSKINNQGVLKQNYEIDAKSVSDCTEVYPPICTLVKDSDNNNKITPGDEYLCTVKENTNYTFYVLSKNDNGTHNLIMNSNICEDGTPATAENTCRVKWISEEDYGCGVDGDICQSTDKGPITAMTYLNNATSTWSNIPNMDVTYDDEGNTFTNFPITGKTRLIYVREATEVGCDYFEMDSCPLWITGNYSYWTLASVSGQGAGVFVHSDGCLDGSDAGAFSTYAMYGVRPVITLTLD